jgi:hypothetical protein
MPNWPLDLIDIGLVAIKKIAAECALALAGVRHCPHCPQLGQRLGQRMILEPECMAKSGASEASTGRLGEM